MIYLKSATVGGFSGPTIILRKHDIEALTTMTGGAKSPENEKSLWFEFSHGAVCASNGDGLALVQYGDAPRDWTKCQFLPFSLAGLKPVLASIKGKDLDGKTIVGCLVFVQLGLDDLVAIGLRSEDYSVVDFSGMTGEELPGQVSQVSTNRVLLDGHWRPWDCLVTIRAWEKELPPFVLSSKIAKTLTKVAQASSSAPMVCHGSCADRSGELNAPCVLFSVLTEKGDVSYWDVLQGTLQPLART